MAKDASGHLDAGLSSGLAAKLRAFNLGVGNSYVTAAWVIALALVAVELISTAATYTLNVGSVSALEQHRAAQARWYQLKNAELEQTISLERLPAWTLATATASAAGVDVSFPAAAAARLLHVQYLATDNTAGGVVSRDVAPGAGLVTLAPADLGAAWVPGGRIILKLEQQAEDGRAVRYAGPGIVVEIP